jgi:hypothetical protein
MEEIFMDAKDVKNQAENSEEKIENAAGAEMLKTCKKACKQGMKYIQIYPLQTLCFGVAVAYFILKSLTRK